MIHSHRVPLVLCATLALAGCSSNNPQDTGATGPAITAPTTSTDPGTRYLDPGAEALGGVTVETPPVDGAWASGQTSIARPVPGTPTMGPSAPAPSGPSGFGSPDGSMAPAAPGGLPTPNVRRSPAPPPPPPLR